jgi:hypothetical protein
MPDMKVGCKPLCKAEALTSDKRIKVIEDEEKKRRREENERENMK